MCAWTEMIVNFTIVIKFHPDFVSKSFSICIS